MGDFNFFSSYVTDKKKSENQKLYIVLIISITAVLVLGSLGYNLSSMYRVNKEIKVLNDEIQNSENQVLLKKSEALNKTNQVLNTYFDGVNLINHTIEVNSIVSGEFMANISKCLPKEVSFKTMAIESSSINIQGVSKTRAAIAEFEHNMRDIKKVENIHVSVISGENKENSSEYSFSLKCSLKGEGKDENKK